MAVVLWQQFEYYYYLIKWEAQAERKKKMEERECRQKFDFFNTLSMEIVNQLHFWLV